MNIDDARVIAADILINGVTTRFRLRHVIEAYVALFVYSTAFKDHRPEEGAMLILTNYIDTLTTLTTEV